jgi:hypothetical protein
MRTEKKKTYWPSLSAIIVWGFIGTVLFSLSLPCPPMRWIERGSAIQAMTEINNIKLSITYMLSDAGSTNLRDFFDDASFGEAVARLGRERALAPFAASMKIYTDCTYVLLRKGRQSVDPVIFNDYPGVFDPAVVKLLANSYYPELAFDPWGELYRIFPGPWPEDMGPVIFRTYLPRQEVAPEPNNLLMSGIDIETGEPLTFGVPAPSNQDVYIWSFGANLVSGQPIYDPSHAYAPPAEQHYEGGQEPELMGGGDDINNWDRDQTFMRFYN